MALTQPMVAWLRKPRIRTNDLDRAERSMFQWSPVHEGGWGLSILGAINGPLPRWLRIVAVLEPRGDQYVLRLRKRWW